MKKRTTCKEFVAPASRRPEFILSSDQPAGRRRYKALSVLLLILIASTAFAQGPMSKPQPVKLHFLGAEKAKSGAVIETRLEVQIDKEWHLFSEKPEIPGVAATQLMLEPSDAFTVDKIVFPSPVTVHSDIFEKDLNFYQGQATISMFLKLKPETSGNVTVKGTLKFQSCSDKLCMPPAKLLFSGIQIVEK